MSKSHSNLGDKLKLAMQKKQVSNAQLAVTLGVTRQRVNSLLQAQDLKWSTIVKIADAVGMDVFKFLKL